MRLLAMALVAATMLATQAHAAKIHYLKAAPNGASAVIWRDEKAFRDGFALVESGINVTHPELFIPLVACVVRSDEPVVVLNDSGAGFSEIMVVGGRSPGCRGVIDNSQIIDK